MLREPRPVQVPAPRPSGGQNKRFRVVKLEERIAPTSHTNPHGKWVGKGGHNKGI